MSAAMPVDETTPLVPGREVNGIAKNNDHGAGWWICRFASRFHNAFVVENRILLAGFLITLSFSFSQVPIFYVFHLIECDIFYNENPPFEGPGDRCTRDEIASRVASDFSILGMTTTLCGIINLFVAGWTVKKFGPRLALMVQTFVPAVRVATQMLGVVAGGQTGINVLQISQIITIIGGPSGYILVINIIAGELVKPARRTAVFGMLQGCFMLGQGIGLLTGGMMGDAWGIRRPFEVACCSFLLSTVYVRIALPRITPESMSDGKKRQAKGIAGLFSPLKVMAPQKVLLSNGKVQKHYGIIFLFAGVFLGVLATDYAAFLIQMYATAAFAFHQADNGWLMSGFAFSRGLFLVLVFPSIISGGRKWYLTRHPVDNNDEIRNSSPESEAQPELPVLPTRPEEVEIPVGTQGQEEPTAAEPAKDAEVTHFDLFFLRWSLVADGALTMLTAFATEKWHIYLAALLIPLASGTAPAAKGVLTQMCSPSQRVDAMNALTLVENIARLSTQGLFGFIFAALAAVGKSYLTFFCNAALALLAAGVLLFSRFAPRESRLLEDDDDETADTSE